VLASLILFLAACGRSGPSLAPLPPDGVILAFGDSLTHGTGAGTGESYPEVLARETGRRGVGAGVPGEVSGEGLRRLPGELERLRPALVVLVHGGNDLLRHRDRQETAANLRNMVRLAREAGAQVVLLGVPAPDLSLSAPPFYREVAEAEGVPADLELLPEILGKRSLKSDAVHPNAAGYRKLAQGVAALLRESGALAD
jgi:lysophospholipase L1-like esterase